MNIVIFSGGRGTNTILKSLLRYKDFHVTICLNAYDDGLSTGALRKFIPNFLGPSDIRKNASVFLSSKNNTSSNILVLLLEYRFPSDTDENLLVQSLIDFCEDGKLNDPKIDEPLVHIKYSSFIFFQKYIRIFISFYQKNIIHNTWFSLKDMSFGNLVLAGIFLDTNSFNNTIDMFTSCLEIPNSIVNITKGENLILSAITEDGQILETEADIVAPHGLSQIDDIYLLETEKNKCNKLTHTYLINNQILPDINEVAENKILNADLIIYGPGTQSASLFPSYLTKGCAEAIAKNRKALKIYVSNLKGDNDYPTNNPVFLFRKFLFYINRKGSLNFSTNDLITDCLINSKQDDSFNANLYNQIYSIFKVDSIIIKNFENSSDRHSGIFITQEIISIISKYYKLDLYKISNPIQKIGVILLSTNNKFTTDDILNFKKKILLANQNNIEFDFILITNHDLNSEYDCFDCVINTNLYLDSVTAISEVLKFTDADNFILFPFDGSYSHNDLNRFIINMCLIENSFFIASRAYSTRTLDDRLSSIYRTSLTKKYLSKLGGRIINLIYFLLYRIIISDPFSRFITFNRKCLTNLPKNNSQFSIYHNIILESKRQKLFLIEVPIFYDEKNVEKKNLVKISYGLKLLFKLIFRIK